MADLSALVAPNTDRRQAGHGPGVCSALAPAPNHWWALIRLIKRRHSTPSAAHRPCLTWSPSCPGASHRVKIQVSPGCIRPGTGRGNHKQVLLPEDLSSSRATLYKMSHCKNLHEICKRISETASTHVPATQQKKEKSPFEVTSVSSPAVGG